MWRSAALASVLWLAPSSAAHACLGYPYTDGIAYFEAVPRNVTDEDLVLEVEFDRHQVATLNGVVTAHVRRVLHGIYSGSEIRVGLGGSSCTDSFQFGRRGIVVGRLVTPEQGQAGIDALENGEPSELRLMWPYGETVLDPVTETRIGRAERLAGLARANDNHDANGDFDGDGRIDTARYFEDDEGNLVIGVHLRRGSLRPTRVWSGDISSLPRFTFRSAPPGLYHTACELYGDGCGSAPAHVTLTHDGIIVEGLEDHSRTLYYWSGGAFRNVSILE